jgi:hypothetical protein
MTASPNTSSPPREQRADAEHLDPAQVFKRILGDCCRDVIDLDRLSVSFALDDSLQQLRAAAMRPSTQTKSR